MVASAPVSTQLRVGFGAAAAAAIFGLPWLIPPFAKAASESYNFGFNNLVSSLATGLAVVAAAALLVRGRTLLPPSLGGGVTATLAPPDCKQTSVTLVIAAANVVLVLGFWLGAESSLFGESPAFLHAADQLLIGRRAWTDFVFPYGPLLLYPHLWLSRATGLPLDAAYVAVLAIHVALGTWLLARVIAQLDLPGRWGAAVLALVAIPGFNLTLGLNYAPLRFALPVIGPFVAEWALRRDARLGAAIAAAWTTLAALVSPEMGLASAASLTVWCAAHARAGRSTLVFGAAAVLAAPVIVLAAIGPDYAFSVLAFGAGGYNLPLFPTAHALVYLAAIAIVVPALLAHAWRGLDEKAPLAGALAVGAMALVPGALGRCDPGHLYWNGLAVFILAPAILLRVSPNAAKRWLGVFAFVFGVGLPVSFWSHYGERVTGSWETRARYERDGFSPWVNRRIFWQPNFGESLLLRAKMPPPNLALTRLDRYPKIGAPVSFSEDLVTYLKLTGRYVPERVPAPLFGILNETQLAWKLEDLEAMDVLLFPERYRRFAAPDDRIEAAERSAFLSRLLLFPVSLDYREDGFFPERIVVRRILEDFEPVDRIWDYDVMVRTTSGAASDATPASP